MSSIQVLISKNKKITSNGRLNGTNFVDAAKIRIPLQIDSLAVLHKNTKALGLYDILIESVCRSIRLIEKSVANQKSLTNINDMGVPKTFNFKPRELGHFFSCVYLTNSVDEGLFHRFSHAWAGL